MSELKIFIYSNISPYHSYRLQGPFDTVTTENKKKQLQLFIYRYVSLATNR